MTTTIEGWTFSDGLALRRDGNSYWEAYVNTGKGCLRVNADERGVTDLPLSVVRALLESAGYTVRDRAQETLVISNVADIVGDRDAARAEVARLRALCAEASWACDERELVARLAAAGKGEP